MLTVDRISAGYGEAQVLFDLSFSIGPGEFVTMLGRNGMGKTTTVRTVMGLLSTWRGTIVFDGRRLERAPPFRVAQAGLGLVPEGRQVFPTLTVEENLVATAAARHGPARWTLPRVYELFPRLAERRRNSGAQLSGGEQQMLAIGRALMTNPKLLILDEATEGLAPLVRAEIWACLAMLKREGEAILVIDKNLAALVRLADRHIVLEKGHIVWTGTSSALASDAAIRERYLQV
jgi:branched-chain amino acid transport system ATP-binding protein